MCGLTVTRHICQPLAMKDEATKIIMKLLITFVELLMFSHTCLETCHLHCLSLSARRLRTLFHYTGNEKQFPKRTMTTIPTTTKIGLHKLADHQSLLLLFLIASITTLRFFSCLLFTTAI